MIDIWQAVLLWAACCFPLYGMWMVEAVIRAFVARDGADSYIPNDL